MKKSTRSTYSQIWKRWTRTLNQSLHGETDWRGSKVHQNTEIYTDLMVSRWNSSGTFSQDSPHCSSATKSKSSCRKWATNQKNLQDGSSSCRCSTDYGDLRTTRKNASQMPNSLFSKERDSKQENGNSLGPNLKKKLFYQWRQSTRWMAQNDWNDDVNRRKQRVSLPSHESIVQRSVWKQKWLEKIVSSRWNVWRWILARWNGGEGERLWKDNRVPRSCQVWRRQTYLLNNDPVHEENKIAKNIDNELKSYHNKTDRAIFVQMQDTWLRLNRTVFSWRKTLKNSHNSQIWWPIVNTLCQETQIQLIRKVDPVFRATSPLSRGVLKSKGGGKIVDPLLWPTWKRLQLFFAQLLLQRYGERIEKLPQQDKLRKFCTDAGFLTVVQVGQHFMTKDTEEFLQFTDSVACREYTLPRNEDTSEPKGWISTKIGPVLEVTTCCLQGKYGVEIRIMSVNNDNSHSWVRIFSWPEQVGHGLEQQGGRRQRAGNFWDEVRRICR